MSLRMSVVISTHDRPDSLAASARAVAFQRRRCDELIIVNDGTGDSPPQLLAELRDEGLNVIYHRQQIASLTASRNAGIELAGGDIVVLLDDDVIVPVDFLERLERFYDADSGEKIGGIAGMMVDRQKPTLPNCAWAAIASAFASNRWFPWRSAAHYTAISGAFAVFLKPARAMSGGAISLRRDIARRYQFNEAFSGYALAEDVEYTVRVGAVVPLFVAGELLLVHDVATAGRPDMRGRGRMYAQNMLYIARVSAGGGAGTYLMLGYHLAGLALLASAWAAGSWRRKNLDFALGLVEGLLKQLRAWARREFCGC